MVVIYVTVYFVCFCYLAANVNLMIVSLTRLYIKLQLDSAVSDITSH